jgi:hypothetical protein
MWNRIAYNRQRRQAKRDGINGIAIPDTNNSPIKTLVSIPKVSKPFVQEMRLKLDNGLLKKADVEAMLKGLRNGKE